MEEAAVHAFAIEQAHGSGVTVGEEDSRPNSAAMAARRAAMVSRASSGDTLEAAFALGAHPALGIERRAGEYSRSRYCATFPQRKPRVMGWEASPRSLIARPFSTVRVRAQQSGQSRAHTEWRISGIPDDYNGKKSVSLDLRD